MEPQRQHNNVHIVPQLKLHSNREGLVVADSSHQSAAVSPHHPEQQQIHCLLAHRHDCPVFRAVGPAVGGFGAWEAEFDAGLEGGAGEFVPVGLVDRAAGDDAAAVVFDGGADLLAVGFEGGRVFQADQADDLDGHVCLLGFYPIVMSMSGRWSVTSR